jgi:methylated-DNA-[protein]-cysteine S-methyltransferase
MAPSYKTVSCISLASPIGTVYAAVEGKKVIYLSFTCKSRNHFLAELSGLFLKPVGGSDKSAQGLLLELHEYFEGKRKSFTYSADLSGCTAFQKNALLAASQIPYGETRTYAWLAAQAGSPRAARAAGQAMAANPVPVIIPCHRVIASSGKLGGFAGGLCALELKKRLLDLESAAN